ncbi:hypothetical protein JCGZ_19763 [Jatropha curcas]|uniref:Aminotransferase-like plant mobile domain-containing protein n=1 Tax=Jatropha curcas TaxID=180498 RepID=A0A067L828_JATCU|nr:hypothetical protein JCGZ_19763 [Jatropha curcas]
MRGFQSEWRHAGESCVMQLFLCEQLRDAAVQSCATLLSLNFDFDSFAHLDTLFAALECAAMLNPAHLDPTQPRFPLAMRYALMERWNDCTHSFIFGYGELTLTPADFTAITRLGFDGDTIPLDDRYQTAALGAELVATLLGVTTRTKYTSQGYVSYEVMYKFWAERIRVRLAAWRELPVDVRPAAPAHTREERDQAARSFIFYIISSQLICTSQNKGDPAVLACLRDLSLVSTFDWASLALAHLYHGLDVWTEVVVSLTGSSSAHSRYGHMSIRSILGVLRVILLLRLDGFPDIWFTAIILTPFWRIRTTGGATLMTGSLVDSMGGRCLDSLCPSSPSGGPYPVQSLTSGLMGEPVLFGREGPRDPYCHSPEASAYCSPSPHVYLRWDDTGGQVPGDRTRHRTPTFYEVQAEVGAPTEPTGVVLGDIPFPPSMEVTLDPSLGLRPTLAIPIDLRQAPPQLQLDLEHATHRYQELYQRFCFARTYIARLYPERHEMELEIGRLRRHQARQVAAVSRLQMENDRLRTRLEVEGIPLDPSNEGEDDDDDSSYDDATPLPPSSVRQAAVGPSRR